MDYESPSTVPRWPMLRVPVAARMQVELCGCEWVRLATHFSHRTFLCTDSADCPACEFLPARNFWYLPVTRQPGFRPGIIELSAAGSADLEQVVRLAFGSFRIGAVVELSRRKQRSPTRAEAVRLNEAATAVSEHLWLSALMAIYGLPQLNHNEHIGQYATRVRGKVTTRAEVVAARLRAGVDR